jgi:hypothetical protein
MPAPRKPQSVTIRYTTSAGSVDATYAPGDTRECSPAEAKRIIEAGHAVPVARNPSTGARADAGGIERR